MPFQSNTGLGVSNHYGPRGTGSVEGVTKTEGGEYEAVINFDGEAFNLRSFVPAGAVVTDVVSSFATGTVTVATVGAVSILLAGQINAAFAGNTKPITVAVPLGGALLITGPTAGYVIVRYSHFA
jgi:hypothetical protein